jgi:hypothetical protein
VRRHGAPGIRHMRSLLLRRLKDGMQQQSHAGRLDARRRVAICRCILMINDVSAFVVYKYLTTLSVNTVSTASNDRMTMNNELNAI